MSLKETLRAMQKHMLKEVSPLKMPPHPDKPAFYTKEQETAMDWEAHMIALAIHRLEHHSSVPAQHKKILHDMHEKFYANPDVGLKHIVDSYQKCMAIKDTKAQEEFENNYVDQKVANYRKAYLQVVKLGR